MADHTHIEWTDATWNPITGCSVISPGCTNCYAMKLAGTRLRDHPSRQGLTQATKAGPVWTGDVRFNEQWLDQPLRWKRARRIFVCAHADLFHENVPVDWIAWIYGVAIAAHHLNGHTFQILTKRSGRMREVLNSGHFWEMANDYAAAEIMERVNPLDRRTSDARATCDDYDEHNPPPGIWLGVSAENEDQAQARLPDLFHTPAAVRWASFEPLIGRIDARRWIPAGRPARRPSGETIIAPHYYMAECHNCGWMGSSELCGVDRGFDDSDVYCPDCHASGADDGPAGKLDWAVVGGENGKRPMHPDWAREIRDACAVANVPFLFKQWGTHAWVERVEGDPTTLTPYRAGKRAAGRMLDGVLHDGYPEVRS